MFEWERARETLKKGTRRDHVNKSETYILLREPLNKYGENDGLSNYF